MLEDAGMQDTLPPEKGGKMFCRLIQNDDRKRDLIAGTPGQKVPTASELWAEGNAAGTRKMKDQLKAYEDANKCYRATNDIVTQEGTDQLVLMAVHSAQGAIRQAKLRRARSRLYRRRLLRVKIRWNRDPVRK